jgi:hypothetical protein
MRPFGFILLLAAIRWRLPEGRLLLAMACIPQSTLPYELVPLALIPGNRREMAIYLAGSGIVAVAATRLSGDPMSAWTALGWPLTFCAGYLPMLYLVVRRPTDKRRHRLGQERRRLFRLADGELKVQVTAHGPKGVTVRVTHLPTRLSVSESDESREIAVRKAQDRLAAIVAERARHVGEGDSN